MENSPEKQPINPSLQKKSAARMAAAQCVYARMVSENPPSPAKQIMELKERLKDNKAEQKLTLGLPLEPNYPLVTAIVEGTLEFSEDIDIRLNRSLNAQWSRERMSHLLIAILQCAIFELFFYKEAKSKIIIDEYTRLSARFFSDAEVDFVHGVLQKLYGESVGAAV
jgi:transcription antitermination factor NusB